ncbi:choice-of-anchor Q domain-containing protein [Virgisporangium aurantiacum]|uniref:Hemolysin n=1 Tax=Virgisporangium aurantiacum TaxID=175570 RepID=A0A8J3YYR2_9ACTN|nr:choice-of-anchor Q domain-containing protein [Virgisporangium aurantiacum]GIJ54484.1 hemolysin [Virgisporangium aurantiacum]
MSISTWRRRGAACVAAALLALPTGPAFAAPAGPTSAGNGGHFHTRTLDPTAGGGAVVEVRAATTYYVDATGDDTRAGTSPATAWRTVAEVNRRTLHPGDAVLFRQGQRFDDARLLAGVASVTYGSYGTGARPVLDGGGGDAHTVDVTAPFVAVQDLQVQNGGDVDKVGIAVSAPDVVVRRVTATGNAIGVQAQEGGDRLRVTGSVLSHNTTVIEPEPDTGDDDYGACGVAVLTVDHVEIDHNTFVGNVGASSDFGLDGSAVEIYGATFTSVHHNRATDNQTFTELGNDGTADTTYQNNLIVTTASAPAGAYGFNVQGGDGRFGGVERTTITNNTIVMRSADPGPLSVGPDADVTFHNNVVQAINTGYTDGPIDEGHNVYHGWNYNGINSTAAPGGVGTAPSSTTANPLFQSATDYHLRSGSPALNLGVDTYGATLDLDDQPRVYGPRVDAGAYERRSA